MLAGNLVVDELKAPKTGDLDDLLHFLDDVADWTSPIGTIVEDWYLAEGTSVGTTAAGLHRDRLEQVTVELEQFMARAGQTLQVVHLARLVDLLELLVLPVLEQFRPHQVGLALHD